ncbi:MAG: hypothetical protein ACLR8Y_02150 [Alistipes indistinctus]
MDYLADNLIADRKNADRVKKGYTSMVKLWRERFGKYQPGLDYVNTTIGRAAARSIAAEDF